MNPSPPLQAYLNQPWLPEIPRLLLESASDVLFHLVAGRLDWVSDSMQALLGWCPEELRHQSLAQLARPGDPTTLQALLVAVANGRRAEADIQLQHRDGDGRWTHLCLAPHRDPTVAAGAIGWIRDIHSQVERCLSQEASIRSLAESAARFRLLAENGSDVVFQTDSSGVFTWVSASLRPLTGWQPEEWIGRPLEQLVSRQHRMRHRGAIATLGREGDQQLELKVRCKGGHDTWIAVNIRQLRSADGDRIGLVGSWRDISRDVKSREMLAQARRKQRAAETQLGQLEAQAAIGFGLISAADGRWLQVNPALCALLGREERTLLGSTWREFTHPEDRFLDAGRLDEIKANLIPSYRLIQRLIKANGDIVWGDISISCLRNADNSVELLIVQVVDITEQKKASEQILKSQMLLEAILEHIDANIFMKDRAGRYLYANHAAAAMIGRPVADILGKTDAELQAAADFGAIDAADQEIGHSHASSHREVVIVTASGEERIFLATIKSLTRHGEAQGLLTYATDITAPKRAEQALRESEQHFRLLAENPWQVSLLLAADGRISWVSPALEQTLGWQPEEWLGRAAAELFSAERGSAEALRPRPEAADHPERRQRPCSATASVIRGRVLAKDGQPHWMEALVSPCRHGNGQVSGSVARLRLIDDEVAAEEDRRNHEERHRLLADHAHDVIWTMEGDGRMSYVSSAVEKLRGYTAAETLCQDIEQIMTSKSVSLWNNYIKTMQTSIAKGEQPDNFNAELEYHRKDGKTTWCEVLAIALRDQRGNFVQLLGMSRNIQERKLHELELQEARNQAQAAQLALLEANRKLQKLATTDSLTGIANRRTLEEKLVEEIARCHRYGSHLTLVMFDIDHFKTINDTHGHQVGDEVLVQICQRLSRQLRVTDSLARWGGEEFMVLMPHCRDDKGQQLAEKLRGLIANQPMGPLPSVSASFGVAQLLDGEDRDHLLQRLDEALYQSKALGRNRVACAVTTVNSSSH